MRRSRTKRDSCDSVQVGVTCDLTMDIEDDVEVVQRSLVVAILAVVALVWYCVLWSLSILGCVAG